MTHVPDREPVAKMDTPVGLYRGTCSCGWKSQGLGNQRMALQDAQQHADALNDVRRAQPTPRDA